MGKRILNLVFILAMAGLVITFGILSLRVKSDKLSKTENRTLAPLPSADVILKDSFPDAYELWHKDHFPNRNLFLNSLMGFNMYVMKQTPLPDNAIIGKEMWLYYTAREIEVYRGTNRFTEQELTQVYEELERRRHFIEEQGAKMMLVVAPTKYSVYPEFVPASVNKVNDSSRTDQFVGMLEKKGIPLVDLRKALLIAKKTGPPLFFKTDNHWNFNGAFAAYQAIITAVRKIIPDVGPPLQKSEYKITVRPGLMGNIGKMLFLSDKYAENEYLYERITPNQTLIDTNEQYTPPSTFGYPDSYEDRYTNGNKKSPKILIIRDSFGFYPSQFLKEHFSSTVLIFDEWQFKLNPDIIKQEKPDLVIFMMLESFTNQLLKTGT